MAIGSASTSRRSELVAAGGVTIETFLDGERGRSVVLLPSYGRDGGEDVDRVAAELAWHGHRVLRPQPRGVAGSHGPMDAVTLEDQVADVTLVIEALSDGPAIVLGHAFGNFVARALAVRHPGLVSAVVLAAAAGRRVDPEVNAAPFRAGDPALPEEERLAALRLAFFAPGHDPRAWLTGWYPDTLAMQRRSVAGIDLDAYWGAGDAPIIELIAELDPFHQRDEWTALREAYGERVRTSIIENASHALFPEQPDALAEVLLRRLPEVPR